MIKIGNVDKKLFLPILAGILYFPLYIIIDYSEVQSHYIIFCLCSSLGMCLSFIPLIISRINMKKSMENKIEKHKQKNNNSIEINLIYNKISDEIKRYKFFFIFISALTDFSQSIIATLTITYSIKVNFWLLDIFFLSFLSYFILNIKLLKHQILSMIIIISLGVILDLFFGNLFDFFTHFGYFLSRIFCEFSFSFSQIINKYCMEFKFSPPYEVCSFIGIYTLVFYLISLIISTYIPCNSNFCSIEDENNKYFDNFKIYIHKINLKEFFLFFLEMIIFGLINILTILTIKYFTPFHSIIILIIGRIISEVQKIIKVRELYDILYFIILILILFSLLVFLEIIILNFCGIQKYTKTNIEKRGEEDIILTLKNEKSDESLGSINDENESENYKSSTLSRNSSVL